MYEFDRATELAEAGEHRWTGAIPNGWGIGSIPNGGFVAALLGLAGARLTDRDAPLSLSTHYLRPAADGPLEITGTTLRAGRRLAHAQLTLHQDGQPVATSLGAFGAVPETIPDWTSDDHLPPELPPVEDCLRLEGKGTPAISRRLDQRLPEGRLGFVNGSPDGSGEIVGWARLADRRPLDAAALVLLADTFPPAVFTAGVAMAWTPTVTYHVLVRGIPASEWVACRFRTRLIAGGMLEEDAEVWDADGHQVCQARQLALAPLRAEDSPVTWSDERRAD